MRRPSIPWRLERKVAYQSPSPQTCEVEPLGHARAQVHRRSLAARQPDVDRHGSDLSRREQAHREPARQRPAGAVGPEVDRAPRPRASRRGTGRSRRATSAAARPGPTATRSARLRGDGLLAAGRSSRRCRRGAARRPAGRRRVSDPSPPTFRRCSPKRSIDPAPGRSSTRSIERFQNSSCSDAARMPPQAWTSATRPTSARSTQDGSLGQERALRQPGVRDVERDRACRRGAGDEHRESERERGAEPWPSRAEHSDDREDSDDAGHDRGGRSDLTELAAQPVDAVEDRTSRPRSRRSRSRSAAGAPRPARARRRARGAAGAAASRARRRGRSRARSGGRRRRRSAPGSPCRAAGPPGARPPRGAGRP